MSPSSFVANSIFAFVTSSAASHGHHHHHHQISTSSLNLHASISSATTILSDAAETATVVYDAVLPPTETIVGMVIIVFLSAATAWYWQTQVVPVSRTSLALSKKKGPVKDYLDELKEAAAVAESVSVVDGGEQLSINATAAATTTDPQNQDNTNTDDRALERWLFTDWLQNNKSATKPGRQKEPAIPILKDAKWNSGDNPVLVATALISLGVFISSITERVFVGGQV